SSVGPARPSIPTTPATSRFAAVTHTLPGPTTTSTAVTVSVPNAIAATACAPPIRYTASTPAIRAAYRTAAGTVPSASGGVHSTTRPTPATRAGTAVM